MIHIKYIKKMIKNFIITDKNFLFFILLYFKRI